MNRNRPAMIDRRYALVGALSVSIGAFTRPSVADEELERTQLAALVRQLDMLDRTAQRSAVAAPHSARYRFDYARLHADLARVRAGIEDYLSPARAQPRDPIALSGTYRIEQDALP